MSLLICLSRLRVQMFRRVYQLKYYKLRLVPRKEGHFLDGTVDSGPVDGMLFFRVDIIRKSCKRTTNQHLNYRLSRFSFSSRGRPTGVYLYKDESRFRGNFVTLSTMNIIAVRLPKNKVLS